MTPTIPTTDAFIPPDSLPTTAPTPKVDVVQLEAWLAELKRLREERPYPPEFDSERLADTNWFFEQCNAHALVRYVGRFIAIRRQQIVGDDIDPTWLELSLARKHPELNPDQFLIEFVD